MARILAIDYGKKRTGIAATDVLELVPGGVATVETARLTAFLVDYMRSEAVERIVVGEPRQMNGEPSENLGRVHRWVATWRKEHPDVPIEYYDERFTSALAHRAMIDGGLSKKARRDKALVDEISATIILRDYLTHREHADKQQSAPK